MVGVICVGLGNPGRQYAENRHNIGAMVLDALARTHNLQPWQEKFKGYWSVATVGDVKVGLLKPQTYMNLSGESAGAALRFFKLPVERVLVYHDELDLAPGVVKCKQGGGSAGHNGLKSLDQHIGNNYWRVRIGIGHPGHRDLVSSYVLSNFFPDEMPGMQGVISDLVKGIEDTVKCVLKPTN